MTFISGSAPKALRWVNTLRPGQNGRRFADDTFKRIFLDENVRISIKISLKFVPKGPINNNPALVQIMAWHGSGDKPLSEPMMVSLLTHICVTRPQWVKRFTKFSLTIRVLWDITWPYLLLRMTLSNLCRWYSRADSRLAPSQWRMPLQSNAISHWLGTNLKSALYRITGDQRN